MAFNAKRNAGQKVGGAAEGLNIIVVRQYGKFATTTNGEIVKTSNGEIVPDNEPLFIIRGRDHLAIKLLNAYAEMSSKDGCIPWHFEQLGKQIEDFVNFAKEHPEKMKQPSITMGR